MKDYYKILGIEKSASFNKVIKSYNNSINYFNNKNFLEESDKTIIKEIKEAFYILGDYHNRRKYDNYLEGFKKINSDFSDRVFYRPNLEYQHNTDNKLKNTKSDIMNNKKNRFDKKDLSEFII